MKLSFTLYLLMAVSQAANAFLGTDEAAKYIAPENLFWFRGITTLIGSVALTLKGWTSKGFNDWLSERRNGNGNGHGNGADGLKKVSDL